MVNARRLSFGFGAALVLGALLSLVVTANAEAPAVIPYRGRLTDPSGRPINETLSMTLRLYAMAEGGAAAWGEVHTAVTVTDGLFTVYLGESVPLSSEALNANPYLGLAVGTDSEMRPRQRVGSVAYARTLAPGAVISGNLGPLVTVRNTRDAWEPQDPDSGIALSVRSTSGSGPALAVRLDASSQLGAAFASAIYARRSSGIGAYATIQATNESEWPGLAANSSKGTALVGVAGEPVGSGSPAGGDFSGWYRMLYTTRAGVFGYSSIGPGGYFTATGTGLYATSLDGPAIQADLRVSGQGTHGFNHTIVASSGSVRGFAAVLGTHATDGPGVSGRSLQGSGVLGEAGRSGGGPVNDPLNSLSASTGAGVMGYSTIGPGLFAWSTITDSLVVSGNARITGDVLIGGGVITNADVAEDYVAVGPLEAGDVVVLEAGVPLGLRRADQPYDTRVAGIVSTDPAIVLSRAAGGAPLALVGRAPVKVDATYGAIRVGDLLTTSSTPGHAMRCADRLQCVGAIVGKALEPLAGGKGVILALVTLQ